MTDYLPRTWWANSAWSRGGAQLTGAKLDRLGNVLHYPGRSSDFGLLSLDELRSNLRGWWNFHVNTRGWSDIGYQVAIDQRGRVVDLRGIGRVPAAHASPSNLDANWEGGATLLVLGNTEAPSDAMIDAYRHFRHTVWLPRWPMADGITGHTRVPGAQTSCPGGVVLSRIDSGTFTPPPSDEPGVTMSWGDNLSRSSSGPKITELADDTLPSGASRQASGLLGYGAAAFYYVRNRLVGRIWSRRWPWRGWIVEEFPDLAEAYPDGYTMQALVQNDYGNTRVVRWKLEDWEWLRDTLGRAVWSRRAGGDGDMHATRLGNAERNSAKAVAMAEANNALLGVLVERDPTNPLTEERVRELFHEALRDHLVEVDITVQQITDEEEPPQFEPKVLEVNSDDDSVEPLASDEDHTEDDTADDDQ